MRSGFTREMQRIHFYLQKQTNLKFLMWLKMIAWWPLCVLNFPKLKKFNRKRIRKEHGLKGQIPGGSDGYCPGVGRAGERDRAGKQSLADGTGNHRYPASSDGVLLGRRPIVSRLCPVFHEEMIIRTAMWHLLIFKWWKLIQTLENTVQQEQNACAAAAGPGATNFLMKNANSDWTSYRSRENMLYSVILFLPQNVTF